MEKELQKILKIIDEEPEKFSEKIPGIERKIFREVSLLIKDLKLTPGGNVSPSIENLKLINDIKSKIGKIAVSKEYADLVKRFVSNFPAISNYQTSLNEVPKDTKKLISAVTKQNIDNTLESLIGSGYKQEVVNKLNNILLTSVTSGGSYADLTEQLERQLITTEAKPGLLSKYAKTYVVDSLGQLAGQGNKMIADAINAEWFEYVGSNLTTTREFCEHLTKKRYVHKSEFKTLLEGKIDGHQCKVYDATGLPYGMKEDTNVDNFIENRGGWNCGHELIPVSKIVVPKEIQISLAKNDINNFTEKSNKIAEELGVIVTPTNIKSNNRIIEKANKDYGGYVSQVTDIVRNTFVSSQDKIENVINEVKNNFNVVRIKKRNDDKLGYSGTLINVKNSNGSLSEIQINTPQMIYGKEKYAKNILGDKLYNEIKEKSGLESGLGHEFYEKYRILDNEKEKDMIEEIEKQSREYYKKIRVVKL